MSQVISYKKFNADNVTFVTKKGKNVKIFILYNGKSFYLNTPYLVTNGYGDLYALTSYNLNQGNVTDMDEVSDWTMNLKLKSNQKQDDESIEQFKEQFQKFNNKLFEHVLNDSKLIFGKKKSKEVLEDKFKTLLKFSYDEDGEINTEYPPSINVAVGGRFMKDETDPKKFLIDRTHPQATFFKDNKTGKIDETVKFTELREMIPAGALVRNTIKFNFWTKSGNFGVKMYTQNCLFKVPERTELTFENTFGDDSDDESKGVGPVGELIEKPTEKASDESKTDNEGETEDVDDSDSGDDAGEADDGDDADDAEDSDDLGDSDDIVDSDDE